MNKPVDKKDMSEDVRVFFRIVKEVKEATVNWNKERRVRYNFNGITLPAKLLPKVNVLEQYADSLLINRWGNLNYKLTAALEEYCGVTVDVVEQDGCGPLRAKLMINFGDIYFG